MHPWQVTHKATDSNVRDIEIAKKVSLVFLLSFG